MHKITFGEALKTGEIGDFLRHLFFELFGNQLIADILVQFLGAAIIGTFGLSIVIFLIWLERKVIARMQDRVGPNRVGPYGLLQTFADIVKLLIKEPFTPTGADRLVYNLAPIITVVAALVMWAVIPFAPNLIGVDLNIGVFYILAVSSASVVALLLAGWGSNNKYALLGAFRAVAQLVSYEVPMVIALLIPILLTRSMSMVDMIHAQQYPFLLMVPLSALVFFISALAETGRTPFDLLEAESEIVAGFHVEYSGMKFGMFFLAEFMGTLLMSGLFATIYMGGWNIPIINRILEAVNVAPLNLETMAYGTWLGLLVFFVKMFAVYFVFIWIRATWPRVRIDQILKFNWKFLVPLCLVMLLTVAILDKVIPADASALLRTLVHLSAQLVTAAIILVSMRNRGKAERLAAEGIEEDPAHDHHGHDAHGHDHHGAEAAHAH